MTFKQLALIAAAGVAFNGALYLLWYAWRRFIQLRRKARDAKLWQEAQEEAWQPGDHEFCDLTDEEQGWFDYFALRYPDLGREVQP